MWHIAMRHVPHVQYQSHIWLYMSHVPHLNVKSQNMHESCPTHKCVMWHTHDTCMCEGGVRCVVSPTSHICDAWLRCHATPCRTRKCVTSHTHPHDVSHTHDICEAWLRCDTRRSAAHECVVSHNPSHVMSSHTPITYVRHHSGVTQDPAPYMNAWRHIPITHHMWHPSYVTPTIRDTHHMWHPSYVTQKDTPQWCLPYQCVTSRTWMRRQRRIPLTHGARRRVWLKSHNCVMSHINEACHTYDRVMSHISTSHITNMNASRHVPEPCHAHRRVMSHIRISHITRVNDTHHLPITCDTRWHISVVLHMHIRMSRVMSHTPMSLGTHVIYPSGMYMTHVTHGDTTASHHTYE